MVRNVVESMVNQWPLGLPTRSPPCSERHSRCTSGHPTMHTSGHPTMHTSGHPSSMMHAPSRGTWSHSMSTSEAGRHICRRIWQLYFTLCITHDELLWHLCSARCSACLGAAGTSLVSRMGPGPSLQHTPLVAAAHTISRCSTHH